MKATMERSNVIPVSGGITVPRDERSIGTILIHAGRLTFESAEKISQLQHGQGIRFGDAGLQLGLLNAADIDLALARQFDCPYLVPSESKVDQQVVAAYAPFSLRATAISVLRGQLMQRWFDTAAECKALAIVSADRYEGRSFIAANLAVSFSQLGKRTLLIDADMRNAVQHTLFGIDNRSGLSAMLSGRAVADAVIHRIPGLLGLSVLPAGAQPPNPLELLGRPLFPQLLADRAPDFDVIILDSPAVAKFADAPCIAARARAALLVARNGTTRMSRVHGAAEAVSLAGALVVGSVLNDF
jgi:receptor protein-tyrosine kinase